MNRIPELLEVAAFDGPSRFFGDLKDAFAPEAERQQEVGHRLADVVLVQESPTRSELRKALASEVAVGQDDDELPSTVTPAAWDALRPALLVGQRADLDTSLWLDFLDHQSGKPVQLPKGTTQKLKTEAPKFQRASDGVLERRVHDKRGSHWVSVITAISKRGYP